MSLPVFIHQDHGQFVGNARRLAGRTRITAATREEALAEIQTILEARVLHGDLVFVEAPRQGISALRELRR